MSRAMATPTSGTAATSSPASELDSLVSARESNSHGRATSTRVNSRSGPHRENAGMSAPRCQAIGSKIAAPIPVRAKTRAVGGTSRTATRISKYGIPQITHIAANSNQLRRDTLW